MNKDVLDFFGAMLMKRVRDVTIIEIDMGIKNEGQGSISRMINKIVQDTNRNCEQKLLDLVPFIVDKTIHYFLWMLEDEKLLQLAIHTPSESTMNIAEISDGLSGEIFGKNGWISRFSNQRKVDY